MMLLLAADVSIGKNGLQCSFRDKLCTAAQISRSLLQTAKNTSFPYKLQPCPFPITMSRI